MCDTGAILACLFRVSLSVLWTVGEKALMFLVTLAINQQFYSKSSAQLHGGTSLWSIPPLKTASMDSHPSSSHPGFFLYRSAPSSSIIPDVLSLLPLVHLISLYHSPIVRVWANSAPSLCQSESPRSSRISCIFSRKPSSLIFSPRRLLEGASHSLVSPLPTRDWGNLVAKKSSSCRLSSNFFEIVLSQHYVKEGKNVDT